MGLIDPVVFKKERVAGIEPITRVIGLIREEEIHEEIRSFVIRFRMVHVRCLLSIYSLFLKGFFKSHDDAIGIGISPSSYLIHVRRKHVTLFHVGTKFLISILGNKTNAATIRIK